MTPSEPKLTPEEAYLWLCARSWRDPQAANLGLLPQAGNLQRIDWNRLVTIGLRNRMQTMLDHVWSTTGLEKHASPEAGRILSQGVAKYRRQADYLTEVLRQYLHYAAQTGQEVVVIKGLWLSVKIYGMEAMRPGSDIDILLRRQAIPAALSILEDKMGYGRWWRPLLDDVYYYRHHLHQQRCSHDRTIWIEPHWLLDHPYTRLTVNYADLMDRTTPGELFGEPVCEMAPPDLLISLAIHLVKHAIYLPYTTRRPDLARLILADGMLMYFVDVAEVLRIYQDQLNWQETIDLARQSGALSILGSVLYVCRRYLGVEVPEEVMADFGRALFGAAPDSDAYPFGYSGRMRRTTLPRSRYTYTMNRLADHIIATYEGQKPDPFWNYLLGYQESVVFRPIRLLDLLAYLIPGADYLRRRYDHCGPISSVRHLLRATGQYMLVGLDTVTFTLRRKVEVRRLDKQGYVWPELPTDPKAVNEGL